MVSQPARSNRLRLAFSGMALLLTPLSASTAAERVILQGNGFRYYVQEVAPDRHRKLANGIERFTLKAGDCDWQHKGRGGSKDCRTNRERVEVRSLTTDAVGQTVCYRFDLRLSPGYPEISPKQLLGQWHSGKSNVFRNRYEKGKFEIAINYKHHLRERTSVPFRKGQWNRFLYRFTWEPDGSAETWLNGRKVFDFRGTKLLESNVRSVYFKYGVYRSDMDRYRGGPAPTQTAEFRNVSRFSGARCEGL